MAVRYLYLVRHGQFDPDERANPNGVLTPLGKRQAEHTVKAFKDLPINCIHVSTLPRAIQTAEPLIKAFPEARLHRARRLIECIPPVTTLLREGFFKDYTDAQLAQQAQHAERAWEHYFKRTGATDRHEILVCHGNLIRYLALRAMELDPTAWVNLASHNCGITRIAVNTEGQTSLISYNEIGHLPATLLSDNMH